MSSTLVYQVHLSGIRVWSSSSALGTHLVVHLEQGICVSPQVDFCTNPVLESLQVPSQWTVAHYCLGSRVVGLVYWIGSKHPWMS